MTELPDGDRSQAVLIGVSEYQSFCDLPAVRNNLRAMREILTDRVNGWLDPLGCTTLSQVPGPEDVFPVLQEKAALAEDTFLIYFTGHGCIGRSNELYLCLESTAHDRLWYTSLPYQQIRILVRDTAARRRVVVLDCCYSGSAITTMGPGREAITGGIPIEGSYVLTATGATEMAFAPPEQEFTTFSGALVHALRTGVRGGPELLSCSLLFQELSRTLVGAGAPRPHQQGSDTVTDLALGRNPCHGQGPIVPEPIPPYLRTGLDSPHPQIRIGAVRGLAPWLHGTAAQAAAARAELAGVAARDVAEVATVAHRALRDVPAKGCEPETIAVLPQPVGSAAAGPDEEQVSAVDDPQHAHWRRSSGISSTADGVPASAAFRETARRDPSEDPLRERLDRDGPGHAFLLWALDTLWLLPVFLGIGLLTWIGFLIIGTRARSVRWTALAVVDFVVMILLMSLVPEEETGTASDLWTSAMLLNWILFMVIALWEHGTWLRLQRERRTARATR